MAATLEVGHAWHLLKQTGSQGVGVPNMCSGNKASGDTYGSSDDGCGR